MYGPLPQGVARFFDRFVDRGNLLLRQCRGNRLDHRFIFKAFNGTIAIYHTVIGDEAFGTAGVTETAARAANFDIVAASATGMDRHPGKLPGMKKQTVKLIVAADCGVIIGGEVHGGSSIGELTNNIGFLIQNRTSIKSLLGAQIGTQPMLTGSPAGYPLIKAAEAAERAIRANRTGK